ncbi:TetR/AcrR family transcriptional regulator [Rhodohalobacter sulfatireducens]|uniref:TetR/AcrR family transcriptional regulator n=1 Tax=Rhodohalobacter sulfatireducens TaxID=2911366 RepID=A0ABS9KFF6_9BACT|nr:TetR/AcrR family transcriptional regulator [Rhodohalobacter sulfatireducens]MCG2589572.1 TetR/AcrR family transcriptional regulator [Rhodohalobacter sulfatireducens]MDR9366601.1 TetR/AcrR family transcriptional regulator [Balneolaceae bacterium]
MSPRTAEQNEEIRQQTQKQIVDAAFELFANEGYSKTSIAAVAKKAGISKGLIYHYFESKEAILEAIFDQLVEIGEHVTDFPEDFGPAEKIKQTLEQTFEFIEKETGMGRLMVSLALQPGVFDSLKPKLDKVQERQRLMFKEIMWDLGYSKPELEAYQLGALMDGVLMGYITMGEDYPLAELKKKIMEEYVPD